MQNLSSDQVLITTGCMSVQSEVCAVVDLDDLTCDGLAHFTGQIECGICLVARLGHRYGGVDVLVGELKYDRSAFLLVGSPGSSSFGVRHAGEDHIATDLAPGQPEAMFLVIVFTVRLVEVYS